MEGSGTPLPHGLKQSKPEDDESTDASLPMLQEGQVFETVSASVREGRTSPPKHYTEDSLLAAMETAGAGDMPEDTERKGLGTPATRAATLENWSLPDLWIGKKSSLFQRKKVPNLILVLPDNIKSPTLTAEWESMLKQVERGELAAESFMEQIAGYEPDAGKGAYRPGETLFRSVPGCKKKRR